MGSDVKIKRSFKGSDLIHLIVDGEEVKIRVADFLRFSNLYDVDSLIGGAAKMASVKTGGAGIEFITPPGGGDLISTNNLSDVANQQTSLNNLSNVAAATNEHVLTKDTVTGDAIFKASTGGGGETNTASNQGGDGIGVYDTKDGVDLQFRHVAPGSNKITTTLSVKDIDIDVVEGNIDHDALANTHNLGSDIEADYSVISGNDIATDVTGAELEELTDGSETDLHSHEGAVFSHGLTEVDGTVTLGQSLMTGSVVFEADDEFNFEIGTSEHNLTNVRAYSENILFVATNDVTITSIDDFAINGNDIVVTVGGGLTLAGLGDDDTKDHVMAIDDATGIVSKKSIASVVTLNYGSMYSISDMAITMITQNVWYEIDAAAAWVPGKLNNCTFTDPYITVTDAGTYFITWNIRSRIGTANQVVEIGIMIDQTVTDNPTNGLPGVQGEGRSGMEFLNAARRLSTSGSAILTLAAGRKVSLAVRNITSAAKVLTVGIGNLKVVKIGI